MIPTYFPEKFKKMIAHWDDERKSGNALIISLKDGWHHPTSEAQVFGVDSIKEALSELCDCKPCQCGSCRTNINAGE